jgi:soluble lytic murein transglycosylase-like protein
MQSLKTVSAVRSAVILAGVGAFAALAPQLHATASKPATTGAAAVLYTPAPAPALRLATQSAAAAVAAVAPEEALRARIHWVPVRQGGKQMMTLDDASRLLLVQSAAKRAGLADVGLGYQDVYGVINAETSWIPRTGMGKTGTPSYGLAQFEPGTAKGLGLKDPNDPVQAVYAAAVNMRHAADWAADRIDDLKLSPKQYAAKLREGVSVYYNLSTKGRRKWNGLNTAKLPIETQRHIKNVRIGAEQAIALAQEIAG